MKIARIALILVFFILALTVTTGCTVAPSDETWYFFSYREDFTFMNGVTMNLGFSDASHLFPFAGAETENINISFSKDGNVTFTPKDGITRHGTYTYKTEGINSYTSFVITLDNGEVIEGSSMKNVNETRLALEYGGIVYTFSPKNMRQGITTDDVVKKIIDGDFGSLNEVTVSKDGDGFSVRFSEFVYYPIKETTAVFAMTVHMDGTYEIMSELHEGIAFSTYTNDTDYIVIYYLEP